MTSLTSNIYAETEQSYLVGLPLAKGSVSIPLKINGLSFLFNPSEKIVSEFVVLTSRQPLQEEISIEEVEGVKLEVELLEELDSDEESIETLDEGIDEKEDLEEASFSEEGKAVSLDGDCFGEEKPEANFFEILSEKVVIDKRPQKMWQKNKLALLEKSEVKRKINFTLFVLNIERSCFPMLSRIF